MRPIPSLQTLQDYVNDGWISRVDKGDISIFNYTVPTTYAGHWDDVTIVSRGLILNRITGEVVARAFDKFFNYGEKEVSLPSMTPDYATVKWDGSLGIGYRYEGAFLWSTRGSFYSDQASSANRLWAERWSDIQIPDHLTPLVEIITKEAKIIVEYAFEDLILLGIRNRHTGEDLSYDEMVEWGAKWRMSVTERIVGDISTLTAIANGMGGDEEGFVLRFGDLRVKIKSTEYCILSRLLSKMSDRTVADIWYWGSEGIFDSLPQSHKESRCAKLAEYEKNFQEWNEKISSAVKPYIGRTDFKVVVEELRSLNQEFFDYILQVIRGKTVDYKKEWYKKIFNSPPRPISASLDSDSDV